MSEKLDIHDESLLQTLLKENTALRRKLRAVGVEDLSVSTDATAFGSYTYEELEDSLKVSGVMLAEGVWNGVLYSYPDIETMYRNYEKYLGNMSMVTEHGRDDDYEYKTVGTHTRVELNPRLRAIEYEAVIDDDTAIQDIKEGRFRATSMKLAMKKIKDGYLDRGTEFRPIDNSLTANPACNVCQMFSIEQMSQMREDGGKALLFYGVFENTDVCEIGDGSTTLAEDAKSKAKARCGKYPISFKEGKGHLTKPKEYSHVPDGQFADPCNYKYPITKEYVMAAWGYVNKDENKSKGGYTDSEWSHIKSKVKAAMKRHGHKVAENTEETEENRQKRCKFCGTLSESIDEHYGECKVYKDTLSKALNAWVQKHGYPYPFYPESDGNSTEDNSDEDMTQEGDETMANNDNETQTQETETEPTETSQPIESASTDQTQVEENQPSGQPSQTTEPQDETQPTTKPTQATVVTTEPSQTTQPAAESVKPTQTAQPAQTTVVTQPVVTQPTQPTQQPVVFKRDDYKGKPGAILDLASRALILSEKGKREVD